MFRKQRRDERKRGFEERKMASLLAAKRIDDQVFLVKSLRKVKYLDHRSCINHMRGGGEQQQFVIPTTQMFYAARVRPVIHDPE